MARLREKPEKEPSSAGSTPTDEARGEGGGRGGREKRIRRRPKRRSSYTLLYRDRLKSLHGLVKFVPAS